MADGELVMEVGSDADDGSLDGDGGGDAGGGVTATKLRDACNTIFRHSTRFV